jgi:fermentation-respiration switch protein FrsA (DUF1100 family)
MEKTLRRAAAASVRNTKTMTMQKVTFKSNEERIVGTLYLPKSTSSEMRLPAVVITGAWMTVKEQMPARYAAELANRGYAALTFDFRGWGESSGGRRQFEDPAMKIADIRAAFAYLANRSEVDAGRIGGLGICASAGYMAHAAALTPSVRSIALVAPWLHDRTIVDATYGGRQAVEQLITVGDAANAAFASTGRQSFVPAASTTDKRAIMFGVPYYTETDRGMIPAWRNEVDPGFWRGWLTFDAQVAAPYIRQPFAMVHSEAAAIPQGAHAFYSAVSSPKRELWLDEISQFDFYDHSSSVNRAVDFVAEHYAATLN